MGFLHVKVLEKAMVSAWLVSLLLAPDPARSAKPLHIITFDDPANGFASGDAVGEIRTRAGIVIVNGTGPRNPQANDAMIFDATCTATCREAESASAVVQGERRFNRPCNRCTGGDEDLRQPGQRNILIVSESGLRGDPGDSGFGGTLTFDFTRVGTVRVESLVAIDLEEDSPAVARLYRGDQLITVKRLPTPGDGRQATARIAVAQVERLEIELEGSGAIDDLAFCVGSAPDLECFGGAEPTSPTAGTRRPESATPASSGATTPADGPELPEASIPPVDPGEPTVPGTLAPIDEREPPSPTTSRVEPELPTTIPPVDPAQPDPTGAATPTGEPEGLADPGSGEPTSPAGGTPAQGPGQPFAAPAPGRVPEPDGAKPGPDTIPPGPNDPPTDAGRPPLWIWALLVLVAIGILLSPRLRAAKSTDYSVESRHHTERRWVGAPRFDLPDYRLDIRLRGAADPGKQTLVED